MLDLFKKINYPFYNNNELVYNEKVIDISTSYYINTSTESGNKFIFQYYELEEYETAMGVSLKMYDTPEYYWTIFIINNVINPYTDWFLYDEALKIYIGKKYATGTPTFDDFLTQYNNDRSNSEIMILLQNIHGDNYPFVPEYKKLLERFDDYIRLYYLQFLGRLHHLEDITFDNVRIVSDFEKEELLQLDKLPEYIVPISNYEYEYRENQKRKTIKVIPKEYIKNFVKEFKSVTK